MLPERRFRQLNLARLDRHVVRAFERRFGTAVTAWVEAHRRFATTGDIEPLRAAGQRWIDELSRAFLVGPKRLVVRDQPRPHRRDRRGRIAHELHGQCAFEGPIEVFARTAARRQPVALKTLTDTLLHEWVHHYDFHAFGNSVHCAGFYQRVGQLYQPFRRTIEQPTPQRRVPLWRRWLTGAGAWWLLALVACVRPTDRHSPWQRGVEAESLTPSTAIQVLSASDGAAASPEADHFSWNIDVPVTGAAELWVRAAADATPDAMAEWICRVDGEPAGSVRLRGTYDGGRYVWTSTSLDELPRGRHLLELRCTDDRAEAPRFSLDRLVLRSRTDGLEEPLPRTLRRGSVELTTSPSGALFDPPWILRLLAEQRNSLAARMGFDVDGPVVLVALGTEDWSPGSCGAFARGRLMYLPDGELHEPWRYYAHEMFHVFQHAVGVSLPRVFTEATAYWIGMVEERERFGRAKEVARKAAPLLTLLTEGDDWWRPGQSAPNPVFLWGTAAFGSRSDGRAAMWSRALAAGLDRRCAAETLARFYRMLHDRAPELAAAEHPFERAEVVASLLGEAAGRDLLAWFRSVGLHSQNRG